MHIELTRPGMTSKHSRKKSGSWSGDERKTEDAVPVRANSLSEKEDSVSTTDPRHPAVTQARLFVKDPTLDSHRVLVVRVVDSGIGLAGIVSNHHHQHPICIH